MFLSFTFAVRPFGGMSFMFTITVPFSFSIGRARVVSRTSKPTIASAFPVSMRGASTLVPMRA